jgi:hypothetical protein
MENRGKARSKEFSIAISFYSYLRHLHTLCLVFMACDTASASYKQLQEKWVTGLTGGSVVEIVSVIFVSLVSEI